MKSYSTKANANRAAKNAGLEKGSFNILEVGGKFIIEATAHTTGELFAKVSVAEFVGYNPQMLLKAPATSLIKSKIDNPVKMVWEIADRMWGERRKDIIAKCVEMGIAYNTARTQYQAFYKVKSLEAKGDK